MNPGRLNRRVTLQVQATACDGVGQPKPVWNDVATVWAAIWPLRGRELYAAQQSSSEVETRIRIRYMAGITPAMRVICSGRVFGILYVIDPDLRHVTLDLLCRELPEGAS